MFGMSWGEIVIIVLVGVFLLGPERIPVAVQWAVTSLRKARTMAAGAQAQLRTEIGPELDELRRQIADLQSLKEIQELRSLRDLNPRNIIGKSILGDEFSGGISGFLGFDKDLLNAPEPTGTGVAASVEELAEPSIDDNRPPSGAVPAPEPPDLTKRLPTAAVNGQAAVPAEPVPAPAGTPAYSGPAAPPPFDTDAT